MSRGAKGILSNHKTAKALPVPDFGESGGESCSFKAPAGGLNAKAPDHYVSRPISSTDPDSQQWEPTESSPFKQHHRMAGMEN